MKKSAKKPVKAGYRNTITIHILYAGLPLCGFSDETPKHWPNGHVFVSESDDNIKQANCQRCLEKSHSLKLMDLETSTK